MVLNFIDKIMYVQRQLKLVININIVFLDVINNMDL